MNYPRMLFPNGDVSQQYRIVADEGEHKEAIKAGYLEAYSVAPKPTGTPATVPPADTATAPVTPIASAVIGTPKRRGRKPKAP